MSKITLTLDEFSAYIARGLSLPTDRLAMSAHLISELGLDSVQFLELVVIIEDLGAEIPAERFVELGTLEDAYRLYSELL